MALRKDILLLRWFNVFEDFRPYVALAILYFAEVTGSWSMGLLVFSVISISQCVFEVPTGIFSDLIGRKRTMLLGSATNFLGILCYALAQDMSFLIVGAVFHGLSASFFSGNQEALLHDLLHAQGEEKEFAHHHGRLRALFQVGLGLSAIVGGILGEYSLRWVFWGSLVTPVISMIITLFITNPPRHAGENENIFAHLKEAASKFRDNWKLRTLSLSSIVTYGIGEMNFQFHPAFIAMLWPTWAVGLARFGNHALAGLTAWYAGSIIRRYSEKTILFVTESISRVLGLIAYAVPTLASPILMILMSGMYGMRSVSLDALLQKEFTHKQRATMGSLNAFVGNIVYAIAAVSFGLLADATSPAIALLVGQFVMMPTLYFYWRLFRST